VATAFARHQDAGWGEVDLNPMDKAVVIGKSRFEPGLFELDLLNVQIALNFLKWPNIVDLHRYTSINDAAARALADKHEGSLWLTGITELSANTATALSKHKGPLILDGLTELSADTATALSKHKGPLSLDGLTELSADTATALSKHKGPLSLNALTRLSDELAEVLAKHKGHIYFLGLKKLSRRGAAQLVNLPSTNICRSYLGSAAQKVFTDAGTWYDQTWTRNP